MAQKRWNTEEVSTEFRTPLLVVDDDPTMLSSLERVLQQKGLTVTTADNAANAREELAAREFGLLLLDWVLPDAEGSELLGEIRMNHPDVEVIVMTAHGSIESAVGAMRQGAYDYIPKPFQPDELFAVLEKAREKIELKRENLQLRHQLGASLLDRILVGNSPAMQTVKKLIAQVAPSSAPVIIEGESGTGKELVAEAIHQASERASRPLIKLNCAALPETLLEAELFGYERGAFTGAVSRKPGRFDLASGGTFFLDEVVDIPVTTQVKLLRVLQDGKYERLGGNETLQSDVRLIAATNRNLKAAVENGQFREDLYYRLNVISVQLPPLRARKDEVPLLAHHFRRLYTARNNKEVRDISPTAMSCLLAYDWPGNVRELENAVEHAVVLCEGDVIQPQALPETCNRIAASEPGQKSAGFESSPIIDLRFPVGTSMRDIQDICIQSVLEYTKGDRTAAANLLGIHPRTISRHLQEHESDSEMAADPVKS